MNKRRIRAIAIFIFGISLIAASTISFIYFKHKYIKNSRKQSPVVRIFKFLPKTSNNGVHKSLNTFISKYENNFNSEIRYKSFQYAAFFQYYENYVIQEKTEDVDILFVKDIDDKLYKEKHHLTIDSKKYKIISDTNINLDIIKNPEKTPNINCKVEKCIALTFDDGPHSEQTEKLLNELKESNVKATFFVLGDRVGKNARVLEREYSEGHEIGSHTYSHTGINTLDDNKVVEEITDTDTLVYSIIGIKPKIFRPPYGMYVDKDLNLVNKPFIMWTYGVDDWFEDINYKTLAQNTIVKAKPGAIILMHDIKNSTINAVPIVIEELQKQSYKFVTVSQLLNTNNIEKDYKNKIVYSNTNIKNN